MKLSPTLRYSLFVWGISSASAGEQNERNLRFRRFFTAPHEVHQYEQVKFFDEPLWECKQRSVGDNVGCIQCYNPGEVGDEALIVEVKSMYKRENLNEKDEATNKPRKHCIWPERGTFWTCFNSNLVVEPDTDWLGSFSDKPIYNAAGEVAGDGEEAQCLPASIALDLPYEGRIRGVN